MISPGSEHPAEVQISFGRPDDFPGQPICGHTCRHGRKGGKLYSETVLAELVDNLITRFQDDTHCWYCSWPTGSHRADCVWGRAIAWLVEDREK